LRKRFYNRRATYQFRRYSSAGLERLRRSKILRQAVIAASLLLLVLCLRVLPAELADRAGGAVHGLVTHDSDLPGLLERTRALPVFQEDWRLSVWPFEEPNDGGQEQKTGSTEEFSQLVLPVEGAVSSSFGWRANEGTGEQEFHGGLDFKAAEGTPVLAVAGGTVTSIWQDEDGYGLVLELRHQGRWSSLYAHLQETLVREGDEVRAGQVIARVGKSGNAAAPHLHFEIRANGHEIDPAPKLGLKKAG